MSVLSAFGAFAIVLGLLAVAHRLLRQRISRGVGPSAQIEVLARVGLAPRQGVALVRVRDCHIVVSFGDGGVRTLADMELVDGYEGGRDGAGKQLAPEGAFSDALNASLGRARSGEGK
jgi:flagellar biogenesis protein FliO